MDRDANDTFELLDEIEKELGIATCPVNWPIGSGKEFRGVYDREHREIELFSDTQKGTSIGEVKKIALDDPSVETMISEEQLAQLTDEVELLDGASAVYENMFRRIRSWNGCVSYSGWEKSETFSATADDGK